MTTGGEEFAAGGESKRVYADRKEDVALPMPLYTDQSGSIRDLPKPDGVIEPAGCDVLPIRAEGHCHYCIVVVPQRLALTVLLDIPQDHTSTS